MYVVLLCLIGTTRGFLLNGKNSSHTGPTYLTVAEYYNDIARTEQIIDNVRKSSQRNLELLATQIQDQLNAFQQELNSNSAANGQQTAITELEQKYNDLVTKYTKLEQENTELKQWRDSQNQTSEILHGKVISLEMENAVLFNTTTELQQKVRDLEQLRGINQLHTLKEVQEKTQTLDTRVTALANTEQARSQDFIALYQKLTSLETSEMFLKNQTNARIEEIRIYYNKTDTRIEELSVNNNKTNERIEENNKRIAELNENNKTNERIEETKKRLEEFSVNNNKTNERLEETNKRLAELFVNNHKTNERLEELQVYQNHSLTMMQEHTNIQQKPVVLTACHNIQETISAGAMKFNEIRTAIGIPDGDISTYRNSGKFKCQVPGYYFITTTMESTNTHVDVSFMLNTEEKQSMYITDNATGYFTSGTASYTIKLKANDDVWIRLNGDVRLYRACFSIFKIM